MVDQVVVLSSSFYSTRIHKDVHFTVSFFVFYWTCCSLANKKRRERKKVDCPVLRIASSTDAIVLEIVIMNGGE
jgi:hypothetical protein